MTPVPAFTQELAMPKMRPGLVHASEFREGLDWLGVDEPLTLSSLRGRVVLLDFWTYG